MNHLIANAADLAADYKARGMDRYRAWDQFVIDRALRPDMDARDFYLVYEAVSAGILKDRIKPAIEQTPKVERRPDPEFALYGKRVEYFSTPKSRISGLRDDDVIQGTILRTLNVFGGGIVYEIRVVPNGDERRATSFRIPPENVRFLE